MTKEFGQTLRTYILDSEIPKKVIADWIGMHPTALSSVLCGDRNLSPQRAQDIAEILGVPDEELAEFLLLARGYSHEVIEKALTKPLVKALQK